MARRAASKSASGPTADTRICVLYGPDDMQKREHLACLREALGAAHGEVEVFTFDGKSAALADVLDELRSFSLMQRHKVVIVDDADAFVQAHREPLQRYAEAPVESATLVLRAGKWNRGNLDKLIEKVGCIVKCDPMPAGQVPGWLARRAQEVHGRKLEPRAAQALADRLGSDLMTLDSELAKLALLVEEGQPITAALVEEVVGRGSEEDAWAVQEALLAAIAGDAGAGGPPARAAVEKVHELVDLARQPDVLVAYFVADLARKMHLGLMMRRQGIHDGQIARELKLWGPRQGTFMQALRRVTPASAARLFDRLVELDVRAKTGRGETLRNLECFCASLADELR